PTPSTIVSPGFAAATARPSSAPSPAGIINDSPPADAEGCPSSCANTPGAPTKIAAHNIAAPDNRAKAAGSILRRGFPGQPESAWIRQVFHDLALLRNLVAQPGLNGRPSG